MPQKCIIRNCLFPEVLSGEIKSIKMKIKCRLSKSRKRLISGLIQKSNLTVVKPKWETEPDDYSFCPSQNSHISKHTRTFNMTPRHLRAKLPDSQETWQTLSHSSNSHWPKVLCYLFPGPQLFSEPLLHIYKFHLCFFLQQEHHELQKLLDCIKKQSKQ